MPKGYVGVEAYLCRRRTRHLQRRAARARSDFSTLSPGNETLHTLQLAVVAQAKVYGCKVIALDDRTTPDKQVSNMQQLIAQKVNPIIFYPLDPKATFPVLKQAKNKGIPVVAIDGTFGSRTATAPYLPYIATQVWQGRDIQAYLQINALAAAAPAGHGRPDRNRVPCPGPHVPEPARGLLGEEGGDDRPRHSGQPE